MKVLLTVGYDGTNYNGWQRQLNGVGIQELLENALETLLGREVKTTAASRTDAGVHALGQRVVFDAGGLKIPLDKLPPVLNGLLPSDIVVNAAQFVNESFNPRFDAKQKTYAYHIYNAPLPNPLAQRYSAYIPQKLDIDAMRKAAGYFVGRYDFAAFCATGSSAKTTVREIYACTVAATGANPIKTPPVTGEGFSRNISPNRTGGGFSYNTSPVAGEGFLYNATLLITGNAFLYNMVRIIAGTVVEVGMGKFSADYIPLIIEEKDRTLAGKTMPPQGLVLMEVVY
jgi:tRNA pseudouridine38-40 synthase